MTIVVIKNKLTQNYTGYYSEQSGLMAQASTIYSLLKILESLAENWTKMTGYLLDFSDLRYEYHVYDSETKTYS